MKQRIMWLYAGPRVNGIERQQDQIPALVTNPGQFKLDPTQNFSLDPMQNVPPILLCKTCVRPILLFEEQDNI